MASDDHEAQEILLLPFFGQGHLFPFIELTKHLCLLNFTTTLLIPSSLSSTIPSSLHHGHHIQIIEIPSSASPGHPPPGPGPFSGTRELGPGIEAFLSTRSTRPACVVIDVLMSWAKDCFKKLNIPIVALFTSGACAAAMEYGSWKAHVGDLKFGEARLLPGLPEDMAVSYADLRRQAHHHPTPPPKADPPPHGPGLGFPPGGPPGPKPPNFGDRRAPPKPDQQPRWLDEVEGTVAIMINTCRELEGSFIDYVANQISKPILGVGPLLPEEYWKSTGSPVHDHDIRSSKQSNYTEEEVNQWLDSKSHGSVIYISFGSEVGPTMDEYAELASALEESERSFIWVIRPGPGRPRTPPSPATGEPSLAPSEGYYPNDLDNKVGERGLIIRGWAPQLLILSHPSLGGFLSHCGWNSTVEAMGRGVPILAWPIRGDQHHNAKLVVNHLKVGYMVKQDECLSSSSTSSEMAIKKEDVVTRIEKLMSDQGIKQRASVLQLKFESGFPVSSKAALDAFKHIIAVNVMKY